MQKKTKLIIGTALLLGSVFYAITQETAPDVQQQAQVPRDEFPQKMDPETWEILGPAASEPQNAWWNTPEMRDFRRLEALYAESPEEYSKLFPKSDDRLAEEAAVLDMGLNPDKYRAQFEAEKTPEEQAEEDRAAFAILHPQEYYQQWLLDHPNETELQKSHDSSGSPATESQP